MLSGLRGESLVWTDLDRWRQRLLASPWVRDAALRRSLPSTVEVVVWERQPIGIGRLSNDMYLDRRTRGDHRPVRTSVRGSRPADRRRSVAPRVGTAQGPARPMPRGRNWRPASSARSRPKPDIAPRLSQIDVRRSPQRAGDPERRRGGHLPRRGPVSRAARKLSRARADAARSRGRDRSRRRAVREPDLRARRRSGNRRQSGTKRTVPGRARRRHLEGDGGGRRDARRRAASTSSASASPSRAASGAASSSTSRQRSIRSRRRSKRPS